MIKFLVSDFTLLLDIMYIEDQFILSFKCNRSQDPVFLEFSLDQTPSVRPSTGVCRREV